MTARDTNLKFGHYDIYDDHGNHYSHHQFENYKSHALISLMTSSLNGLIIETLLYHLFVKKYFQTFVLV